MVGLRLVYIASNPLVQGHHQLRVFWVAQKLYLILLDINVQPCLVVPPHQLHNDLLLVENLDAALVYFVVFHKHLLFELGHLFLEVLELRLHNLDDLASSLLDDFLVLVLDELEALCLLYLQFSFYALHLLVEVLTDLSDLGLGVNTVLQPLVSVGFGTIVLLAFIELLPVLELG